MKTARWLMVASLLCGAEPVRAQFATIINSPPTIIGNWQSIGSNTQLNVLQNGSVGSSFSAGASDGTSTNIEMNVLGGSVGYHLTANGGSTINISGGSEFYLVANAGSEVNLSAGGIQFDANSGSVVNVFGGRVRPHSNANSGSVVNLVGGEIDSNFDAFDGSVVNISGGTTQGYFHSEGVVNFSGGVVGDAIRSGGTMNVFGGDFRLDGALIPGLKAVGSTLALGPLWGNMLSGTLADGTPFAFSYLQEGDVFDTGLTLTTVALPEPIPTTINVPTDLAPLGVRNGQMLILNEGGALGANFGAGWGSTVSILGGTVGSNFEIVGAQVNIAGGVIASGMDAFRGSVVSITGGKVNGLDVFPGSRVEISGGAMGDGFGRSFAAPINAVIKIYGSDFRFNGVPIDGLNDIGDRWDYGFAFPGVLSGVFADGTPFAFTEWEQDFTFGDTYPPGEFTLEVVAAPTGGPSVIATPASPAPLGVHAGQTLIVDEGGVVGDHFGAGRGSTVFIRGGTVGSNFEAVGAKVAISGGVVGGGMDAFHGSEVNVSGGIVDTIDVVGGVVNISGTAVAGGLRVGSEFDDGRCELNVLGGSVGPVTALGGSVINIAGGEVESLRINWGATVTIGGGSVGMPDATGGYLTVNPMGELEISGGTLYDSLSAALYSAVNITGLKFVLDGVDITGTLTEGEPLEIVQRDVTLTGFLADGTPFDFMLGSTFGHRVDYVDPDALFTITLREPLAGDYDGDGGVDGDDFLKWQQGRSPTPLSSVDLLNWQTNFGVIAPPLAADAAVPEPASVVLLLLATECLCFPRRRML